MGRRMPTVEAGSCQTCMYTGQLGCTKMCTRPAARSQNAKQEHLASTLTVCKADYPCLAERKCLALSKQTPSQNNQRRFMQSAGCQVKMHMSKHSSTSSNNLIAALKPAPLHNHCAALCLQLCATLVSNNGLLAGAAVVHIVQCINLVGF